MRLKEMTLTHKEAAVNTSSPWLCSFPSKVTLPASYSLSSWLLQFTASIWGKLSRVIGFRFTVKEETMEGGRVSGVRLESILGASVRACVHASVCLSV